MRSLAQMSRLVARFSGSHGVGHARLALSRIPSARPSRMPLPHAYTVNSLFTAQLCQRVVKVASPCPLLNVSCMALHMHSPRAYPRPCDDDGVDVRVGVGVGEVVCVGVSRQDVCLGVGLVIASLPHTSLDS